MKQLLTCLVYVYALVLVPNSVAAQTTWDYYYLYDEGLSPVMFL